MPPERIFPSDAYFRPHPDAPIRSVISESPDAAVVAWQVQPGQCLEAHVHPRGQDTWTILAGEGAYIADASLATRRIKPGDVVVARTGEVHGVLNDGAVPLRIISVVSPADAGFEVLRPT